MDLHVASATDTGRLREQNEDSLLADPPLIAVADGMGGHAFGEVASKRAIEVLSSWKDRLEQQPDTAETLREAFREANRAVFEEGQADSKLQGMGTTLTAAWIDGATATLAHVGDSRAYLLRGGEIKQLTEDQTVAQEWVRRGRISEDEAASSSQRHVLLQAIGGEPEDLNIEIVSVELQPGDRLLIASDGLSGMVRDADIGVILAEHPDPDDAARVLIDAANAGGGEDNISVVLIDADGPPASGAPAPVVIEKPAESQARTRRFPRRALLGAGAVVLAAAAVVLFLVRPTTATYVVSSRQGNVVVLEGRPGRDDKPARGRVVRTFRDQPIKRFPDPVQRQLRTGIVVPSLSEARIIVEGLPRRLGEDETPSPTPKPTPTMSPQAKTPLPTSSVKP